MDKKPPVSQKKIKFIYLNRNQFSNNQLARKLKLSKRQVLNALKYLNQNQDLKIETVSKRKINLPKFFWPVFLFFISLTLRIIYYWQIKNDAFFKIPILDAADYNLWAQKIARGEPLRQTVYFIEPGFAYVLGLIYKIFPSNFTPLIYLQFLLGSLNSVLIYLAGKKFFKSTLTGITAGLLIALSRDIVLFDALLLKTSLEIFLISLFLFLLAYSWPKPNFVKLLFLGFFIGTTSMVKANFIVTLAIFILLLLLRKDLPRPKIAKFIFALFMGTILPILPITYHNWSVGKDLVLLNYSDGPNIYIGNWPGADGTNKQPDFITALPEYEEEGWKTMAENYVGRPLKPSEISRFWTLKSIGNVLHNPGFFIKITLKKIALLFNQKSYGDNYDIEYPNTISFLIKHLLPFWTVACFGTIGIIISIFRFKNRFLHLYLPLLTYTFTLIASHIVHRYRLPLMLILALFVGYLFKWLKEQLEEENYGKILMPILGIFLLGAFSLIPIQASRTSKIDMDNNFGLYYKNNGEINLAKRYFQKAIDADKKHPWPRLNLAEILLEEGDTDQAVKLYQEALLYNPQLTNAYQYLKLAVQNGSQKEFAEIKLKQNSKEINYDPNFQDGLNFLKENNFSEAILRLEKAYQKFPESEEILTNLATAHKNNSQPEKAKEFFAEVFKLNDYNLPAKYNYANLLSSERNYDQSIKEYEDINQKVPNFFLSRYYLAGDYFKQGNKQKALENYLKFIQDSKEDEARKEYVTKSQKILGSLLAK